MYSFPQQVLHLASISICLHYSLSCTPAASLHTVVPHTQIYQGFLWTLRPSSALHAWKPKLTQGLLPLWAVTEPLESMTATALSILSSWQKKRTQGKDFLGSPGIARHPEVLKCLKVWLEADNKYACLCLSTLLPWTLPNSPSSSSSTSHKLSSH